VVLVDDVADVRRLVRTALRFRGGFDVVAEAENGADAIAAAEQHLPDLVVLDLGLPDIAGSEVLSSIRASSPRTKVVVFSGTESADRASVQQRADGFVLKDRDLDYLVDLLESVGRVRAGQASYALTRDLREVAPARRFVRQTLDAWQLTHLIDDALLVVTELVANAMTHAESDCQLRLSRTPTTLRVEVLDDGTGTPEPQPPTSTSEHGRGLHLIAAVTAAWGLELIPDDGKMVWAEFSLTA
jgi:DNA-binding NarL/FixJ family response regulator